jgi:hypothetical protein
MCLYDSCESMSNQPALWTLFICVLLKVATNHLHAFQRHSRAFSVSSHLSSCLIMYIPILITYCSPRNYSWVDTRKSLVQNLTPLNLCSFTPRHVSPIFRFVTNGANILLHVLSDPISLQTPGPPCTSFSQVLPNLFCSVRKLLSKTYFVQVTL